MEIDLEIFLDILVTEGCQEPKRYEIDGSVNYRVVSPDSKCAVYINGDDEYVDKEIADEHVMALGMFDLVDRIPYNAIQAIEPVIEVPAAEEEEE